jgi:hypothetical protein
MPGLKTSEGYSHYIRYARARYVDNRKSLQRSSDALALRVVAALRWLCATVSLLGTGGGHFSRDLAIAVFGADQRFRGGQR